MTDIEAELVAKLSSVATVYPLALPEKPTFPAIVYQRISTPVVNRTHTGQKTSRARFQFSVYSKTYATCRTKADAIDTVLDMKQGVVGELTTNENRFDIKEVEPSLYRVVLEYFIWYS
jgi:hypothetical protein